MGSPQKSSQQKQGMVRSLHQTKHPEHALIRIQVTKRQRHLLCWSENFPSSHTEHQIWTQLKQFGEKCRKLRLTPPSAALGDATTSHLPRYGALQRVWGKWWKPTEYTGSFKSDCKEIPELLCLFFGLLVVVYSPITKLHDFFASLIRQLIDTGAL